RLALVTILQFAEGLSDLHAAHALRTRIDWKYVTRLEVTDRGFDGSVLSEFRSRLLDGACPSIAWWRGVASVNSCVSAASSGRIPRTYSRPFAHSIASNSSER